MKKELFFIFIIMLVSLVACQKITPEDVMEKKTDVMENTTPSTGDATVDSVGNDLNNVDNVDKDLSADELGDLDSGLSDVENI